MDVVIDFNINEGKKVRFRSPNPLANKILTVGTLKTTCPFRGGELWTVEELPECIISADSLEIVQEDQEEDGQEEG